MCQEGSASPDGSASAGEDVKPSFDQTPEVSHITLKFVSQAGFEVHVQKENIQCKDGCTSCGVRRSVMTCLSK